MITDEQKKEVIAAIEQLQDKEALQKIAQAVKELTAPKQRAPLGFARGNGIWMADDFDEPLEDFADYM
ncbi:DUF2281 domain-containing protein [Hymenobacter weizhouensis]|uniref:DUF2281 domain-containing protein n=1 Tax=Hymenobacter sp. YIM 151500-1 TaxID=2987689 RepID=UPI002227854A|nr:DUF2281 domain-containing protein [Hymenobacter sp. YIM 151500-1]UYZ61786.1 DUF2281 domain-containing protein [Hymenobacter sp. YIM 151500-1]